MGQVIDYLQKNTITFYGNFLFVKNGVVKNYLINTIYYPIYVISRECTAASCNYLLPEIF
jgi:hypothetical protein